MARSGDLPVDLLLIRHGESEGNVSSHKSSARDVFLEQLGDKKTYDYRLTKRGRDQAIATGAWLRKNGGRFDGFFTSDMVRAMETSALLGLEGASWKLDWSLREQSMVMESRSCMDLAEARTLTIENFLSMLGKNYAGKRVVVVCHATVIRSFCIVLERLHYADAKHLESGVDLTVWNCEVFWYTSRHPVTRAPGRRIQWRSKVVAYVKDAPTRASMVWHDIREKEFSNEDLLASIAGRMDPLLITASSSDLDLIIPIRARNEAEGALDHML